MKQDDSVEQSLEKFGINLVVPLVDPSTLIGGGRREAVEAPVSANNNDNEENEDVEPPMSQELYECLNNILKLECNLYFPPCEIGTEVRRLCRSTCDMVQKDCSSLLGLPSSFCDDLGVQEKDSGTCVNLFYEGANRMLWIAGFSIALAFSFLAALGLNLQKLSMNKEKALPVSMRRPPIKQPLWAIGLTLITSGSLLDFVAFGMAPQSLLAPLGALSLGESLLSPLSLFTILALFHYSIHFNSFV